MSRAVRTLAVVRPELPEGIFAIPLRTRLVAPGDDLVGLIGRAVEGIARAGDVVAVSETVVAIAQGEFVGAEFVRPSKLAFAIARRADPMATISQPESTQLVIDAVGWWRVLGAALAGTGARLLGRRGAFYEMLGEAVAAVDGYTGTMPPYERAIVLAPREPDAFAESVQAETRVDCAVVDANDLGKAKVLGRSAGVCDEAVCAALLDNPHGNSDEQTPIVVLRRRSAIESAA